MKAFWALLLLVLGLASSAEADYRTLWSRTVDRSPNDFPSQSFMDGKGNLVVAGTSGQTGYFGDTTNILVYMISDKGLLKWVKVIDGPGHRMDAASCVEIDSVGNVIVGGTVSPSAPNFSTWGAVFKLSGLNGATLWTRYYKGLNAPTPRNAVFDLEVGPNNEVFWTGYGQSLNNATGADIVVEKILATGAVAFSRQIKGVGNVFDTGRFIRLSPKRNREVPPPVTVAFDYGRIFATNPTYATDAGLLSCASDTGVCSQFKFPILAKQGTYNSAADLCVAPNGDLDFAINVNPSSFDTSIFLARVDSSPFGTVLNSWSYGTGDGKQELWTDIVADTNGAVFGLFNVVPANSSESSGRLVGIGPNPFTARFFSAAAVPGHRVLARDLHMGCDGMLWFCQQDQTTAMSTFRCVSRSGFVPLPQPPSPFPGLPGYAEEVWPQPGGPNLVVGTTEVAGNWQAEQVEVQADLTVEPVPPSAPEIKRGGVLKMRVVLAKAAAADTVVKLKCTGTNTVPASVTIPKGSTSATFDFKAGQTIQWSDVEAKGGGFKANCCVSVL
jgi:hypothetical protein